MAISLYTPGHGLVTDTLIMHGIVRVLSWFGTRRCDVERLGEKYEIKVLEGVPSKSRSLEVEDFLKVLSVYRNGQMFKLRTTPITLNVIKKFHRIHLFNVAAGSPWTKMLLEGLQKLDLSVYSKPNHAIDYNEGRRGKLKTLYLPIGIAYGKYVIESYEARERSYTVCSHCLTFSTLGAVFGTGLVFYRARKQYFHYVTVSPSKATLAELILFQRGIEDLSLNVSEAVLGDELKEPPPLAILLYVFSKGETVYVFDNPVDILMWGIEVNGSIRAVELTRVHGNRLLDVIARLKERIPGWPRIADVIMSADPIVLQLMAESILFGADTYTVMREYRRLAEDLRRRKEEYWKKEAYLMLSVGAEVAQVLTNP